MTFLSCLAKTLGGNSITYIGAIVPELSEISGQFVLNPLIDSIPRSDLLIICNWHFKVYGDYILQLCDKLAILLPNSIIIWRLGTGPNKNSPNSKDLTQPPYSISGNVKEFLNHKWLITTGKKCKPQDYRYSVANTLQWNGPLIVEPPRIVNIPKLIHFIWVGDKEVPEYVIQNMRLWKRYHPEWICKLWTNDDLTPNNFSLEVLNKVNEANHGAQKADIIRIFILLRYGGMYVDADFQCFRSIEPFMKKFPSDCYLASEDNLEDNWKAFANGWLACTPGNLFIRNLSKAVMTAPLNQKYLSWDTGPGLLGKVLSHDDEAIFVPPAFLYPTSWRDRNHGFNPDECYGNHHWAASWFDEKSDNFNSEYSETNQELVTYSQIQKIIKDPGVPIIYIVGFETNLSSKYKVELITPISKDSPLIKILAKELSLDTTTMKIQQLATLRKIFLRMLEYDVAEAVILWGDQLLPSNFKELSYRSEEGYYKFENISGFWLNQEKAERWLENLKEIEVL